jgi:hypothetical protein
MSRNVTRRRGQEAIAADEKGKEGTTERAEEKRKSEYMYSANGADKGVGNKKREIKKSASLTEACEADLCRKARKKRPVYFSGCLLSFSKSFFFFSSRAPLSAG